jgi:dTDP-4-dehydrorhamnose reductase
LIACDLTVDGEAARQIVEFRPQVVIHLAGQRRHDILRRSPANSRLLNVDASGAIAAACEYCSAWLIFVSADAVFDGSTPPYAETAQPNPLSEYGWHKLHAEKLVLAACPRAAILRLPLLYGPVESLDECLVTAVYEEMKNGRNVMDHCQRFYPTWTGDVAQVMRMMVELHLAGTDIHGVFHWQGQEQYTKYDIARVIASACGFEAPFAEASSSHGKWAPVADDVRLDCSRLQNLFAGMRIQPTFTSLQEGLRVCLSPMHGRDLMFLHNSAIPVTEPNLAAQIPAVVDAMCSKPVYPQDNFMHDPGSEPSTTLQVSPEGSGNRRSLRHTRQSAENVDPAKVNRADKQSHPGAQGDRHATRAAALKNIFREELELAWRRYRDAAVDGKAEEEFPSRAALAFLDRHN